MEFKERLYLMLRDKKPASQWAKEKGIKILDPDGWDRNKTIRYVMKRKKIEEDEFLRRAMRSTIEVLD